MTANTKRSIAATAILIVMGIVVLLTGEKSLVVLMPAAVLVWFAAAPKFRSGRH